MGISWQGQTANFLMKTFVKPVVGSVKVTPRLMKFSQLAFDAVTLALPVPRNCEVTPVHAGGVPCEWVVCHDDPHPERVFIYLHGGGYFFGSPRSHRAITWRISQAGGMKVLAVDYRQPPDWEYPAPIRDAVGVYQWLLARGYDPRHIVIGGDSAGGNLTLATMVQLRKLGLPLPSCAVLISPWTDLTTSGASIEENADADPMIPVRLLRYLSRFYAGGNDPADPLISPIHADYRDFPPLLVQCGSTEVLRSDAERVAWAAHRAGVPVTLSIYPEQMHVFHALAYYVPEGKEAFREIGRFMRRHMAG